MKSVMDIIRKRVSVRTYQDKIVGETEKARLMDFLKINHKGPFGNSVRFEFVEASDYALNEIKQLGTYGMIRGAKLYLAGAAGNGEKAMEDFGYCMEAAVLKATELGLGTCWLGGSLDRSVFGQKIGIQQGEIVPAVISIGYAVDKRPLKERIARKIIRASNRKDFDKIFFSDGKKSPMDLQNLGKYETVLESVRLAPSAGNIQPWRVISGSEKNTFHFYLDENYIYNHAFRSVKLQNMDIGIGMCHFELAAKELGLKGKWKTSKPGIDAGKLIYIASWVGE